MVDQILNNNSSENLQSVVPHMEELLRQHEEAKNKLEKKRLEISIENLTKQAKYEKLIKSITANVQRAITREALPENKVQEGLQKVTENWQIDPSLKNEVQKIESLPDLEKALAQDSLANTVNDSWQNAVAANSELFVEQKQFFQGNSFTYDESKQLLQANAPSQKEEILEKLLPSAVSPEKAKVIASALEKFLDSSGVNYGLAWSKSSVESAVSSVAVSAPEIIQQQINLSPQETRQLVFSVQNQLKTLNPPELEIVEAAKQTQEFLAPATNINPLRLIRSNGNSVIAQQKEVLFSKGITPQSANELKASLSDFQKQILFSQRIAGKQIDKVIQKLIDQGVSPGSPLILELRNLQQATDPSPKKISLLNRLADMLLGREKVALTSSGRIVAIERASNLGKNIGSWLQINGQRNMQRILKEFSAFGKSTKSGFGFTLPSGLFGGILSTASRNFPSVAVKKFGNSLGNSITGMLTGQNPLLSRLGGGLANANNALSNGLTKSGKKIPLLVFAVIGVVVVLGFIVNMTKDTAFIDSSGGKNLMGGGGDFGEITSGPITMPEINCTIPRHLAEQVICRLTQKEYPCNIASINQWTKNQVVECINIQSDFPNSEFFKQKFYDYHCYYTGCPFQCLQFVEFIQEALGQKIESNLGTACLYFTNTPPGYKEVSNPTMGDIIVWPCMGDGTPGHIAIYFGTDGKSKVVVAEAIGTDGKIYVRARPNSSYGSGPGKYLRYCPGGNCE